MSGATLKWLIILVSYCSYSEKPSYRCLKQGTKQKRALSLLPFDFLRSSTTLYLQTYARKTHAGNVSVHKSVLEDTMITEVVEVSENQVGLITLYVFCLSVVLCHRRCVISILLAKLLLFVHTCKYSGKIVRKSIFCYSNRLR